MEQINLGYSFKDIPLPDDKTYLQILIESWEKSDKQMRWRIFKVLHPEAFKNNGKNNFGFRTSAKAPQPKPDCPSYKPFMEFTKGMCDLISNVKFNKKSNAHLERLKADIAKISKEERVLMCADKTSNLYFVKNTENCSTKVFRKITRRALWNQFSVTRRHNLRWSRSLVLQTECTEPHNVTLL